MPLELPERENKMPFDIVNFDAANKVFEILFMEMV